MIVIKSVSTFTPALQRLAWLVVICHIISYLANSDVPLQFDYGNATAKHSLSVPAGVITIIMVTVTITTITILLL